jgi:MFS family permease
MRTFHMTSTAVGLRLALVMGVAGLVGALGGGYLVDKIVSRSGDARWSAWSCAAFIAGTVPFSVAVFTAADPNWALALYVIPTILNHMILGPVVATMQNLAGVTRRAMAAAFYLFLVNLVSSTLGPLLIGLLSDTFQSRYGEAALRYSLLLLIPTTSAWAVVHFYLAGRSMRKAPPLS